MYVDDKKLAGKKRNIDPMWKVLNKEVDLGEPTSFLDHVYQGCTQRQNEISKDIVHNYRAMFESRISAGATEKIPCSENLCISSWSYDMEGHAKTTQQLYKVSTPCIDDHHFKKKKCVEGLYPTPHIHEQMTAHIMATSTTTLSTTR